MNIERPQVNFAICGTEEEWKEHKDKNPDMYHVVPAALYVSKDGIVLVTSQEWCDWLHGKTDKIPN